MSKVTIFLFLPIITGALLYAILLYFVASKVNLDNRTNADAILVLGARSYKNGTYNPCLKARVEHGVELYRQGYGKTLIFSGGNDIEDNRNEAETMQEIALSLGASPSAILLEKSATSTYENIFFSKQVMEMNQYKSVIIVTEPFHSARASLVAEKLGVDYSLSPTTTSQCWLRWKFLSRYFLREPLGIIKYRLGNKI